MFEILGAILLVLLTMVSYASGITLVAKRRDYEPSVADLLVVVALWILVFALRPQFSRWPMLGVTIGLGVVTGVLIGALRLRRQDTAVIIPESELPEHAKEKDAGSTAVSANIFKRSWHRWNDFAGRMGNIQGRMLMGFFYFVFVTPFGVVGRLFVDALHIKKSPPASNWKPKEQTELTIEAASEQG